MGTPPPTHPLLPPNPKRPARRQLLSYQYPVNLVELQMIVDRVAIQTMTTANKETAAATAGRLALAAAAAPVAPLATAAPAPAAPAKQGGCGCAGSCSSGSFDESGAKAGGCGGGGSSSASTSSTGGGCCGGGQPALAAATAVSPAAAAAYAAGECDDLELCSSEFWFVTEVRQTGRGRVHPGLRAGGGGRGHARRGHARGRPRALLGLATTRPRRACHCWRHPRPLHRK